MSKFSVEECSPGWKTLSHLMNGSDQRALSILEFFFAVVRDDAVKCCKQDLVDLASFLIDPDMMQSRLTAIAGLDDEEDGFREKRKEALGRFILAPFRPSDEPQIDFISLAHKFFELVLCHYLL